MPISSTFLGLGTFRATLLLTLLAVASQVTAEDEVDFARHIRPLLNSKCAGCHGADEENRVTEFRVDTREGIYQDFGECRAVVPGKPHASEIIRRIESTDPSERMPPPEASHALSQEEVRLIRLWVDQGAAWSEHWAFVPPQRPAVPEVANLSWVRNPIDAFVLRRFAEHNLAPAPDADRPTLLRRLSLDLIGLPPTLEELDYFLEDLSPDAYTKQVERLLRSPHYGERWGRIWLDAARYADSDGFEKDKPRSVWMYRDYVIQAHNQDLPYDQFIIEQIAGDLLPNATQDQHVATGFLRNSMLNEEGGIDPEQFRMEAMFDRMDAVGKAVLGLTLQCSQCHNHKYDPLTQTDYYRMFALLNNSYEAKRTVYSPPLLEKRSQITAKIHALEEELRRQRPTWRDDFNTWLAAQPAQPSWEVLRLENAGDNGQRYLAYPDGSLLAGGYAPTKHTARFRAESTAPEITAFRLETLLDPNLPAGGPGRSIQGLFALTEFQVEVADKRSPERREWVTFKRAVADFSNSEQTLPPRFADREGKRGRTGPVDWAIDGDDETAWGIDRGAGRRNRSRQAIFVADQNVAKPGGTILTFHLVQKHGGWNSDDNQNMNLGRFRISATAAAEVGTKPLLPQRLAALLDRPQKAWGDADWQVAFEFWRTQRPEWRNVHSQIESLWRQHPEGSTQLVYAERPTMRTTFRLERGDFLQPAEAVEPGVPSFLHALNQPSPTRLDLARWLVDRDSPTTARAIVNRVWQAYWGTGFVATSEDFGLQGELPSHPELLDWLAVEFMENGWSLKQLHRLVVQSHTYRQSSHATPRVLAEDPSNRLFARGARFRVDAELVRDISLAASGLLNRSVGGPSVYPPAPEFLFQPPASYGPKTWAFENDESQFRRALYTFRFRSTPYPVLQVFDAPNGDTACVRRSRSNTPLQALATLNEPLFVRCAQGLAEKTLAEGGVTDLQRVTFAFRSCVSRVPREHERRVLLQLLGDFRQQLRADSAAIDDLVPGEDQVTTASDDGRLDVAAWLLVCRVILNLDETLTRE